ncbi:chemerin-like receptor 2 [Erpetoichthys calabaricus]|uniref:chemerin-like receptor 2 n=1 Tax=Erpetoichthys calabaricus TaxID=27687 RepID=UPI002234A8FE|nr:chemerin-like receptor 2 [Erpetoichthys calabaricus]
MSGTGFSNLTMVDYSKLNFRVTDKEDESGAPWTSLRFVSLAVYIFTFFLGSVANGVVVWITGFRMQRTGSTILFLNLAIADFVFTSSLPFSIVYTAMGFHWPFGRVWCKLSCAITVSSMYSSIFHVVAISCDRCLTITAIVWAQSHRTPKNTWRTCLLIWGTASFLSLPYFYFRDMKKEDNFTKCFLHVTMMELLTLTAVRFAFGFVLPLLIILICYSIIAYKCNTVQHQKSIRPLCTIAAIIVTFFTCWVPFHVFQLLELQLLENENPSLSSLLMYGIPLSASVAAVNSCLNPILYVCMSRNFQEKFRSCLVFSSVRHSLVRELRYRWTL